MLVPILVFLSALVPVSVALAQTEVTSPASTPATAGARHYAVTLLSSFEPIPGALLPNDLKEHRVYRAQSVIFGKTIYFVRLGFFVTPEQATSMRDKLLARYPGAFMTEVLAEEFRAATLEESRANIPPTQTSPQPAPSRQEYFVVTLAASEARVPAPAGLLPAELKDKRLYLRDTVRNGISLHSLQLGFFASAAEAELAKKLLASSYPQARVQPVSHQEHANSARTMVSVPIAVTPTIPTPEKIAQTVAAAGTGLDKQANDLLERSRAALTRGDNKTAIRVLGQLLKLPPNRHSQDAQELIGLAHERHGETAQAKEEYVLYLRLYPEGEGTERVRQRLANLEMAPTTKTLVAVKKKQVDVSTAYGGLSQYYYRGNSRAEITQMIGPTMPETLTALDQSALISNLDITGRFRSGDYDNRVVVRDSYTLNFLENAEDVNRLYSAYAEVRNKLHDYSGRLGRQPGNSGGVLGRFDGISMGYSIFPKWRVNIVAGEPVEFNPINSDKQFWGTSLDLGTFAEHWNGSAYYLSQTVDGIIDRQAVGTELRYFDPHRSMLSLVDYDLSYGTLNIALLQGTLQVGNKTNMNLLIDHRKAPVLQTSNAVIGETDTSIRSQLLTLSEDQLRALAETRTPTADLILFGATHNFSPTWQLGGDIKRYNISGTPASGTLPASPGTGNVYVYTVQGIGTGLLTKRDVSVLSLSYLVSDTYDGESVAFNNRTLIEEKWTFDLSLRYYQQKDNQGTDLTRLTPILRIGYRWRDKFTFEFEAGMEKGQTTSSIQTEDSTRNFYALGYRWDF